MTELQGGETDTTAHRIPPPGGRVAILSATKKEKVNYDTPSVLGNALISEMLKCEKQYILEPINYGF